MTCSTNIKSIWPILQCDHFVEIVDVRVDSAGMVNPVNPHASLILTGPESGASSVGPCSGL